MNTVFRCFSK